MTCDNLPIDITREYGEIVGDLMPYRNRMVETDADCNSLYRARAFGRGNTLEEALHDVYTGSHVELSTEGTENYSGEALDELVQINMNAETGMRAEVNGLEEHDYELRTGLEALESVGFEPTVTIDAYNQAYQITEALRGIEEDGATIHLAAESGEVSHPSEEVEVPSEAIEVHCDQSYSVKAKYDPERKVFVPDHDVVGIRSRKTDENVRPLEDKMEEALDEFGLLE